MLLLMLNGVIPGQYGFNRVKILNNDTIPVTSCNDGSWCCGNGTLGEACCEANNGLFLINGSAVRLNLDSPSSSTVRIASEASSSITRETWSMPPSIASLSSPNPIGPLASTTSSSGVLTSSTRDPASLETPTSSTPDVSSSPKKSSNNTGVIVGGAISSVFLAALIIGIAFLLWKRHKRPNLSGHGHETLEGKKDKTTHGLPEALGDCGGTEMNATPPIRELDPSATYHEIP